MKRQNPLSLWSIRKLGPSPLREVRTVSTLRVNEWLAVLGFAVESRPRYLNYRSLFAPRLDQARWQKLSRWLDRTQLPVGGVYLIEATKESAATIADESQRLRAARTNIAPVTFPNPTARQ